MRYQAAIFDLDGTLVDTLADLADAMNAVLADFGMPRHPADAYRYFVGDGMLNLALRAAPLGTSEETARRMATRMDERYAANWHSKSCPYPGIPELLEAVSSLGLRLAVLSNKPHRFTGLVVSHFFPDIIFDAVYGARDHMPRKPDPAGALAIANELGIDPRAFLYFGDTDTDMRTGVAAGMRTIGVAWGFRPTTELTAAGAHDIIHAPQEALALARDGKSEGETR